MPPLKRPSLSKHKDPLLEGVLITKVGVGDAALDNLYAWG
jgi:hypothetical protein